MLRGCWTEFSSLNASQYRWIGPLRCVIRARALLLEPKRQLLPRQNILKSLVTGTNRGSNDRTHQLSSFNFHHWQHYHGWILPRALRRERWYWLDRFSSDQGGRLLWTKPPTTNNTSTVSASRASSCWPLAPNRQRWNSAAAGAPRGARMDANSIRGLRCPAVRLHILRMLVSSAATAQTFCVHFLACL